MKTFFYSWEHGDTTDLHLRPFTMEPFFSRITLSKGVHSGPSIQPNIAAGLSFYFWVYISKSRDE